MSRIHLHVRVKDLAQSIDYYSALFGSKPTVVKDEYAKWMLDDPMLNFAISKPGDGQVGINHVGIQTDNDEELDAIQTRLHTAGATTIDEKGAQCCYAESNKHWAVDPNGLVWESFHTMGEAEIYNEIATQEKLLAQSTPTHSASCC